MAAFICHSHAGQEVGSRPRLLKCFEPWSGAHFCARRKATATRACRCRCTCWAHARNAAEEFAAKNVGVAVAKVVAKM